MGITLLAMLFLPHVAASSAEFNALNQGQVLESLFDIREYGASAAEGFINTLPIQKAIDACSDSGGGVVLVAAGRYETGTIYLKDNVTLHVAEGAVLLGSADINDYATDTHKNIYANEAHMDRCLIFARNARNIAIEGKGAIDGQGQTENFPNTNGSHRPMLLRFFECKHLGMRDIHLVNPASWTSAWLYCEDIVVEDVRIESLVNWNGDGLDFDGCSGVRVRGCSFNTSDDAICLQASRAGHPCKDIIISDCIMVSKWAGIRIGLSSLGDFENVVVTNCIFRDISDAGLKIQMCEGGVMTNMLFSNLVMQNVPRPVFMTFNRFRMGVDTPQDTPPMNFMGNMQFSNIHVDNSKLVGVPCGFVLSGVPGHSIENIIFHNIFLRLPGGGAAEEASAAELPSFVGQRPEFQVFGEAIPFAGFYARQVRRLKLSEIHMETLHAEARPAVFLFDVEDATLRGMDFFGPFTGPQKIVLEKVVDARISEHSCASASYPERHIKATEGTHADLTRHGADH